MSRRKNKDYEDEYEYEDEEEEEYEDDYEDDYVRRNPLKPFVIVLIVLLLLLAAIIGLLYFRLQAANARAEELSANLSTAQTEINQLLQERTNAAAAALATPEPTPAPTPEPPVDSATPEPAITPTPTLTPTPTVAPTPSSEYIGIDTSAVISVNKNPQNVTVAVGGSATFTVDATNDTWWAWRFISPDGVDEVIFDKIHADDRYPNVFTGVTTAGGNSETFTVNNITASMNGWKVVCLLWDNAGGLKATEGGVITVQ